MAEKSVVTRLAFNGKVILLWEILATFRLQQVVDYVKTNDVTPAALTSKQLMNHDVISRLRSTLLPHFKSIQSFPICDVI